MKESKNHIEAAPKFLLKGSWEGAASLISLRSTIFYFFVLLSSMLFCFAFHSDLGALFRQTFPCERFQFQQIAILWHPAKWVPWKIPNHLQSVCWSTFHIQILSLLWTKPSVGVTPLTPGHPLCKGVWPSFVGRYFVWERSAVILEVRHRLSLKLGRMLFSSFDKNRIIMSCLVLI